VIRANLREADIPARYGGEEFAIIMPETGASDGEALVKRLCRTLEETPPPGMVVSERITASVGVAAFPDDAKTSHDLVEVADKALYHAKFTGRNRVCRASERPRHRKNQYLC